MIELKPENLQTPLQIKTTLSPLVEDNDFGWLEERLNFKVDKNDFAWLKPVVDFTLDESVIIYLNLNQPNINRFASLDLQEHIAEATNLINTNLAKKNELYELETKALASALEYLQISQSLSPNEKLGKLRLKADYNQSGDTSISDYSDALDSKFTSIRSILRARLSLHNQNGNSLNYGERIKYLRRIYCDNIKNIYERLFVIKRTLKYSFEQDTAPLPNFLEISNKLDKLIWWMRNAISKYETEEQYDYVIQKTISLRENSEKQGLDDYINQFHTSGEAEFVVSNSDFDIDENFEKLRVVGVSLNIVGRFELITEFYDSYVFARYGGSYQSYLDLYDDPKTMKAKDNVNNDVNNRRAYDYSVKANNDTKSENILHFCKAEPPKQNPMLNFDTLFTALDHQERKKLTELKNKISDETDFSSLFDESFSLGFDLINDANLSHKPTHYDPDDFKFPTKLIFGERQPIYKSSINTNLSFRADNSVKNISPNGKWKISVENVSFDKDLRSGKLGAITDIALTFRLGVRKH